MRLATGFLILASLGSAATRDVLLTWAGSTSAGQVLISYNVLRCTMTGTVKCTPISRINLSPVTTSNYTDTTAVIGDSYIYGVEAVAPACVAGVPAICGISTLTETPAPVLIPSKPAAPSPTATVTITVTGKGIVAVIE